jgi:four helix bundle protein
MGRIEHFEDLIAWQKARELTRDIYAATRKGAFSRDFGLSNQIQRASVSIMANLAEGFERGKRTEFHQFTCVAKASCAEVRSHLYVALDTGYISLEIFNSLTKRAIELGRILGGLRLSLETNRARR